MNLIILWFLIKIQNSCLLIGACADVSDSSLVTAHCFTIKGIEKENTEKMANNRMVRSVVRTSTAEVIFRWQAQRLARALSSCHESWRRIFAADLEGSWYVGRASINTTFTLWTETPNNFPPRLICSFSYCRLPATSTRVQFAKCRVQAGNWLSNNLRLIFFLPKFLLPYGTLILQVLPALALSNNLTHVIRKVTNIFFYNILKKKWY